MKPEPNIAVAVNDLEKKFGSFTAVNRIGFEVRQGEIFGFLGPNGAGKSTTIKMLCGILVPSFGCGTVGGYDIIRQQKHIRQNIGYMSQRFSLYDDLTVEENINFYSGIYRVPKEKKLSRKEWIIEMAGIGEVRKSLTRTLAAGWKQRLALGCAIIHEPKIVFLDEPTSGVDPIARNNFWKLIKEMAVLGVTIFVTTHYMDEAENCDRLALIYQGNIVAIGTPTELRTEIFKAQCFEITVENSQQWVEKLAALPCVSEASLFGTRIHAMVANAETAQAQIRELFSSHSLRGYKVENIEPHLEDVFVSLIESYEKKHREDEAAKSKSNK